MTDFKNKIEKILERIEWASNTHKEKLMFGRDELGASIAREHRLHGTLIESKKFIIAREQELQKTRDQLEKAEKVISELIEAMPHYGDCSLVDDKDADCDCWKEGDVKFARQYFQDKENKENRE